MAEFDGVDRDAARLRSTEWKEGPLLVQKFTLLSSQLFIPFLSKYAQAVLFSAFLVYIPYVIQSQILSPQDEITKQNLTH